MLPRFCGSMFYGPNAKHASASGSMAPTPMAPTPLVPGAEASFGTESGSFAAAVQGAAIAEMRKPLLGRHVHTTARATFAENGLAGDGR